MGSEERNGAQEEGKMRKIMRWFKKVNSNSFLFFLMIFSSGLMFGTILTVVGFIIFNLYFKYIPIVYNYANTDPVAIANTYIVFTTLILMLFAFFATIYTIWFSKWFQQEKTHELRENMRYLAAKVKDDDNVRKAVIEDVLLQDVVIESLVVIMREKYEKYMNENFSSIVGDKIDELRNRLLKETCNSLVIDTVEKVKKDEEFKTELVNLIKQELKEKL